MSARRRQENNSILHQALLENGPAMDANNTSSKEFS